MTFFTVPLRPDVTFTPSHLHTFTPSHLHTFTPSHLRIFTLWTLRSFTALDEFENLLSDLKPTPRWWSLSASLPEEPVQLLQRMRALGKSTGLRSMHNPSGWRLYV